MDIKSDRSLGKGDNLKGSEPPPISPGVKGIVSVNLLRVISNTVDGVLGIPNATRVPPRNLTKVPECVWRYRFALDVLPLRVVG